MAGSGIQTAFQESVSAVTSTKSVGLDLGTVRYEGGREYCYIYNAGNSQILPTYGCYSVSGATNYSMTLSSVASYSVCFGVCREATITTGAYGWIMKRGIVTFQAAADNVSWSTRVGLVMGANGVFSAATSISGQSSDIGIINVCGFSLVSMDTAGSGLGYFNCV